MAPFDMISAIFYTLLKRKGIFSFFGEFLPWEAALFVKIEQYMEREGNFVTLDHDFT